MTVWPMFPSLSLALATFITFAGNKLRLLQISNLLSLGNSQQDLCYESVAANVYDGTGTSSSLLLSIYCNYI
jgi:hypothetical protein